jgi:hypothetical protein
VTAGKRETVLASPLVEEAKDQAMKHPGQAIVKGRAAQQALGASRKNA